MKRAASGLAVGCVLAAGAGVWSLDAGSGEADLLLRVGAPLGIAVVSLAAALPSATPLLALLSLCASLGLLEGGMFLATRLQAPAVELDLDPEYYQPHAELGYAPKPGIETRAHKRVDGKTVYDVVYTIDAEGRRVNPADTGIDGRYLLLFGGSFAFGEGVGDRETLAYRLAQRVSGYTVYNYGFHGYGPNQLLARLEDRPRGEIAEPSGDLVYLWIDSHVNRTIGSMVVYSGWADHTPYYELDAADRAVRMGTFTSGRPLTSLVYALLGASPTLAWLGVELPPRITDAHVHLTSRVFARAAELFRSRLGGERVVVAIFPGSELGGRLAAALGDTDVEVLDYADLLDYDDPRYFLPEDWHPRPLTYRILAERIAADLRLEPNRGDS